jgi:hypothetical protein
MDQQVEHTEVTLDKLVALVEKAAQTIERLQGANATLATRLEQSNAQIAAAQARLQEQAERIHELQAAHAREASDAHWCRWFRGKYANSTFYVHIQTAYREDFPPLSVDNPPPPVPQPMTA